MRIKLELINFLIDKIPLSKLEEIVSLHDPFLDAYASISAQSVLGILTSENKPSENNLKLLYSMTTQLGKLYIDLHRGGVDLSVFADYGEKID